MRIRTKPGYALLVTLLFMICFSSLMAQNNLMKEVTIGQMNQQRMASVLEKISHNGNFNFAYNNHIVPADSIVSVSGYRGTVYSLLNQLLGTDYEFKEVPGYIVLRHAPGRLSLTAEIDKGPLKQFLVKGHVTDVYSNQGVQQVSIYEKNLLVSTLTNGQGDFELKLTNYKGALVLTASKENYRDTSLSVLQNVSVNSKPSRSYKYYPDENKQGGLERGFGRFFISSKQRIQNLNLGGFFAYSPYQVSLTPGLSSHGMYNSQVINHFSLNLLGGYTAGIQGVEIAGVFNIDRKDVSFLQIGGLFNFVGGNITGLQAGGLANLAERSGGLQIAGLFNSVKGEAGSQVAGVINIAGKVKGFQLATLVNVADSSDYPIGLVNFIKNGEKSIALSTDEFLFSHVDFRSGGRILYGIIGVGYKPGGDPIRYAVNLGMGAHLLSGRHFRLDGEYVGQIAVDFKKDSYQVNALKLLPGYRLTSHLKLYAGPSFNLFSAEEIPEHFKIPGWKLHESVSGNDTIELHIGLSGGLQWIW